MKDSGSRDGERIAARIRELEDQLADVARKFTLADEELRLLQRDARLWADETYDESMAARIRDRIDG